ncbi:MAG: threo-3-hydroxy-L-aspartate ammonia-lyase [Desulfobacterales bacterium]|nr:threo-3-hydroxy-L-aspartate ammonia-lyase [Desulfobacterales bacterium]
MNLEKIQQAADRLKGKAHVTPVLTSRTLNRMVGAEVFFKCENFQRIGAFKFRGAYNAIAALAPDPSKKTVLTFSSGNHGQAVALVGRMLGLQTMVVMPDNAPAIKRAATEGYGARVVDYDPEKTSREKIARQMAEDENYLLIPPFDHPEVIAGQGTAALELFEQAGPMDWLLAPCGGGGLLSGSAVAARGLFDGCRVVGIEPALADDAARSFRTGRLQRVDNPQTLADGCRTASLGQLTFPLIRQLVYDMQTVSEEAIVEAVKFFFFRMKLVVEPSGALGLAALLSGAVRPSGRVGVILSGGNVDASTMGRILGESDR